MTGETTSFEMDTLLCLLFLLRRLHTMSNVSMTGWRTCECDPMFLMMT